MSRSTSRSRPRNTSQGNQLPRIARVERLPRVTELDEQGEDDDMQERAANAELFDEDGKFAKGHEKRGGRVQGQQNKITKDLKHATLLAATLHGSDGKGKDGLTGYMFFLAGNHVKSFAPILGRMIPLHIGGTVEHTHKVLKSKDEVVEELKKRGLLIEGVYERLEDWTPAVDDAEN